MSQNFSNIFNQLDFWIKKNPRSFDLLDIKNQPLFHKIIQLSQKSLFNKYLTAPFIILAERQTNLLRKVFRIKKQNYAQAEALMARAYLAIYKIKNDEKYLEKAELKLKWLIENKSDKTNRCGWGQPYDWYAKEVIPANTPRATVSTQVANAFIDAYEITKNKEYLDIATDTCHLFIEEFNWDRDSDGHICFSYTTLDKYHIHNSNMLVSSVLIRNWYHTKNEKFKDFGIKAMEFTIKHQNTDGSWYYWSLPDKILGKIDNYHTGFVLESLEVNRKYLNEEFLFSNNLQLGIDYFINNLFENDIPKLTNKSKFPIDIQSCAQAIITFAELKDFDYRLYGKAIEVANWTLLNMYNETGYFYYRIFKNGKIDKTPYIRWSESWMLRALTFLIKE